MQSTGFKDGNNANYKAVLPDTTGWTGDKTIAMTDILDGSDLLYDNNVTISSNITLSHDMSNYKQIFISGRRSSGTQYICTNIPFCIFSNYNNNSNRIQLSLNDSEFINFHYVNNTTIYIDNFSTTSSNVKFNHLTIYGVY